MQILDLSTYEIELVVSKILGCYMYYTLPKLICGCEYFLGTSCSEVHFPKTTTCETFRSNNACLWYIVVVLGSEAVLGMQILKQMSSFKYVLDFEEKKLMD